MTCKCIAAFGEYLWDCHKDYRVPGGAPANALYHAAQFNYYGILITTLGQDADGDALFKELEGKGLDLSKIQRIKGLPTGTVDIDESDLNDRKYDIKTDVAWSAIREFEGMYELAARLFLKRFPNIETLIVTLGTDGSRVVSSNGEETFYGVPKVKFKNAVGAGDAFMGAYLGCILDGRPQSIAHKVAVSISAYVCTQEDALPTLPKDVLWLSLSANECLITN